MSIQIDILIAILSRVMGNKPFYSFAIYHEFSSKSQMKYELCKRLVFGIIQFLGCNYLNDYPVLFLKFLS